MLKKMSISQKAFGAFFLLAAICLVTGGAILVNTITAKSAAERNVELSALLKDISALQTEISEHAILGDSFMLSSNEAYRDAFLAQTGELSRRFDAVTAAFEKVLPDQQDELRAAKKTWLNYSDDWMSSQIALMQRVDSMDFARELESAGEGRERFRTASHALDRINDHVSAKSAEATDAAMLASSWILIIAVISVLATLSGSIGLGLIFNAIVSRPLGKISDVTMELASGKTDVVIPTRDHQDEIARVSEALIIFQQNLLRTRELEAEQAQAAERAAVERKEAMARVAKTFEETVMSAISEITHLIGSLQNASDSVVDAAGTAGRRAGEVSNSTEQTANAVSSVAGAAEEMSVTISDISRQVEEVARMARDGEKAGGDVQVQVTNLGEAVSQIESVVRLIADIAEQTNLLALNATIEAARAGEMGKGFAVVASEVKALASQTANATKQVADQISAVRQSTTDVQSASEIVTNVVLQVNEVSNALAAAMGQQDSATREIAENVENVAFSAKEVSNNITEVAAIAEETGAAAKQIGSEAASLAERARFVEAQSAEFVRHLLAS